MVLQENMKSSKPVWKVMGAEEVEQRQKRRRALQQKKREQKLHEYEWKVMSTKMNIRWNGLTPQLKLAWK